MSWRQPTASRTNVAAASNTFGSAIHRRCESGFNFGNLPRPQAGQELFRLGRIELPVARLDQKEKSVARRQGKPLRIEHGMIRSRQPVHGQHSKNAKYGGAKNRQRSEEHTSELQS